ncbi:PKD domain-containing protein [Arthrobacter psychrolactophilus]
MGPATGRGQHRARFKGPNTFTTEAWFKTTSNRGGKIIGFGNSSTGTSNSYDRQIYMDNLGRVFFGVYPGSTQILQSTARLNNGQWHQVIASLGSNGMALYIDGELVASRTDVTSGQSYTGYWRVGGDNLNSWPSQPNSNFFAGTIDEAAVYTTVLSATDVSKHYALGKGQTVNVAPSALFAASSAGLLASFDGSSSVDTDGSIASYAWDFGDSTAAGSGVAPTHTYSVAGTYQVKLTVTDNAGATGTVTNAVVVSAANVAPSALFASSSAGLLASFDGSSSVDTDGSIASYAWDFGDSTAAGSGVAPTHTYSVAGTYQVKLTVTDNAGATGTVTNAVVVSAANVAPSALFASSSAGLLASFDGSSSVDTDGSIASYAWDFGDSTAAGSGVAPTHTYSVAGTYQVKLTVTDNAGATGTVTNAVVVSAANVAPSALFASSSAGLLASFDGSSSVDTDGSIASYAWDFGDSTAAGSGVAPTHTYSVAGTYQVKLTVTDNAGATGTVTNAVVVSAVGAQVLAQDVFNRTVTNGWGTADIGGAWTISSGASNFAVADSGGSVMAAAGSTRYAYLNGVSATSLDTNVQVSLDRIGNGGGSFVSVLGRRVGTSDYRVSVLDLENWRHDNVAQQIRGRC